MTLVKKNLKAEAFIYACLHVASNIDIINTLEMQKLIKGYGLKVKEKIAGSRSRAFPTSKHGDSSPAILAV